MRVVEVRPWFCIAAFPRRTDGWMSMPYVAEFCSQVSRLIVSGTDEQRATRLLESIPGIRGQRPDPDQP